MPKGGSTSSHCDEPLVCLPRPATVEKAGFLQKWTNYIKGYRNRWFVLDSNGILSYYRLVFLSTLDGAEFHDQLSSFKWYNYLFKLFLPMLLRDKECIIFYNR